MARLDLLDRGSVDQLVRDLTGPLHILVNNAGVMATPELCRSPEGHELQFAANHLGHFRLALALLPALRPADGARVVSVSSRQEDTPDDPTAAGTDTAGVAAYALDPEAAEGLWAVSEQMNR